MAPRCGAGHCGCRREGAAHPRRPTPCQAGAAASEPGAPGPRRHTRALGAPRAPELGRGDPGGARLGALSLAGRARCPRASRLGAHAALSRRDRFSGAAAAGCSRPGSVLSGRAPALQPPPFGSGCPAGRSGGSEVPLRPWGGARRGAAPTPGRRRGAGFPGRRCRRSPGCPRSPRAAASPQRPRAPAPPRPGPAPVPPRARPSAVLPRPPRPPAVFARFAGLPRPPRPTRAAPRRAETMGPAPALPRSRPRVSGKRAAGAALRARAGPQSAGGRQGQRPGRRGLGTPGGAGEGGGVGAPAPRGRAEEPWPRCHLPSCPRPPCIPGLCRSHGGLTADIRAPTRPPRRSGAQRCARCPRGPAVLP